MVAAYEVYRAGRRPPAQARRATAEEKDAMLALWREGLAAIAALPPGNAESAFEVWRTLIRRADLTPREVRLFEHVARKMAAARAAAAARAD
jgi:tRNA C32,U32 (ribose-2'-O)-methylase TrmJ